MGTGATSIGDQAQNRRDNLIKRRLNKIIAFVAPTLAVGASVQAGPVKAMGRFSLYYVAEVTPRSSGAIAGKVQTLDGVWETYRLASKEKGAANMEGSVAVKEADGSSTIVSIITLGRWSDLPKGWAGKGNRHNPLIPYRTVAADQRRHPYGSRIHVPALDGYVTPDGETVDGWFWVADVGGGIKGANRFDIFVGSKPNYLKILADAQGKWNSRVEVENLPKAPAEFNPRTAAGVTRILKGLDYPVDEELPGEDASVRRSQGYTIAEALTDFQKQHPEIPAVEYGNVEGAVTLWFLTKAGLALESGIEYPVTPGAGDSPSAPQPRPDAKESTTPSAKPTPELTRGSAGKDVTP